MYRILFLLQRCQVNKNNLLKKASASFLLLDEEVLFSCRPGKAYIIFENIKNMLFFIVAIILIELCSLILSHSLPPFFLLVGALIIYLISSFLVTLFLKNKEYIVTENHCILRNNFLCQGIYYINLGNIRDVHFYEATFYCSIKILIKSAYKSNFPFPGARLKYRAVTFSGVSKENFNNLFTLFNDVLPSKACVLPSQSSSFDKSIVLSYKDKLDRFLDLLSRTGP